MDVPELKEGIVVCFSYLWAREQEKGEENGRKDRPVIVLSVDDGEVYLLPITHVKDEIDGSSIEVPDGAKRQMGLDDLPQWIVYSEINVSAWPGYDLRESPKTGRCLYGSVPKPIFDALQKGILGSSVMKVERRGG